MPIRFSKNKQTQSAAFSHAAVQSHQSQGVFQGRRVAKAPARRARSLGRLKMSYMLRSIFSRRRCASTLSETGAEAKAASLINCVSRRGAAARDILPALYAAAGDEKNLKTLISQMSDVQLYRLHRKVSGRGFSNLHRGLSYAGHYGTSDMTQNTHMRALLRSDMTRMGKGLEDLGRLACDALSERGYRIFQSGAPSIGHEDNIKRDNLDAMRVFIRSIAPSMRAGAGKIKDAPATEELGAYLKKLDASPTHPAYGQAKGEDADALHPLHATENFVQTAGTHEIIFTGKDGAQSLAALVEDAEVRALHAQGDYMPSREALRAEVLLSQCAGDEALAFRVSNMLSMAAGLSAYGAVSATNAEQPHASVEIPGAHGATHAQMIRRSAPRARFELSRASNGDMKIAMAARADIARVNINAPWEERIDIDPEKSFLTCRFSFTVPLDKKAPLRGGDEIEYSYALVRAGKPDSYVEMRDDSESAARRRATIENFTRGPLPQES